MPTTFTWTGTDAATNPNWTDGNNWSGGVAPTGIATDDLVFDSTPFNTPNFTSVNNFAPGTQIHSLSINEKSSLDGLGVPVPGYSISGNDLVVSSVSVFDVGTNIDSISINLKDDGTGNTLLSKNGAGTLSLSGANTYRGGTSVDGGTLIVQDGLSIGGGTLRLNAGTFRGGFSPITFGSANPVRIGGNSVTFGGVGPITFNGPITLGALPGNFANLTVNNAAVTFGGQLTESVSGTGLIKSGPGTLVLMNNNTYSGTTSLLAGTLAVGDDHALGSGLVVLGDGGSYPAGETVQAVGGGHALTNAVQINNNLRFAGTNNLTLVGTTTLEGNFTLTVDRPGTIVDLGGQVSDGPGGAKSLFKDGPGTLELDGVNNYTGNTFLLAGTLVVGNDGALGTSGTLFLDGGTITANGASHQLANPVSFAADTTFGGQPGTVLFSGPTTLVGNRTATVNGSVVFQGPIGENGTSSLTITGTAAGSLQLAGNNIFSGGITLNGRTTLFINSDGALGSGALTLNGGSVINANDRAFANNVTLACDVTFQGAANLTFSGPLSLNTLAGLPVVRLPVRDTTLTFAGQVTGAGPLVKAGPGSLVVSGPSPAALNTVVLDGAIAGRNSGQLGSLTASGGDVSPGGFAVNGTAGPGTLTVNGNLALTGATTFTALVNGPGTQFDQIVVAGTVAVGGQLQVLLNFSPAVGTAFTLIKNNGTSPVQGFFAGLPEGTVFQINGQRFRITYAGGTGRDVVLTRFEPGPSPPPPSAPPAPVFRAVFAQVVRVRTGGRRSHGFGMALNVFDAVTGAMRAQLFPFGPRFRGQLMVFTADVNGDGVGDLVVFGTQGRGVRLAAFNGKDLSDLSGFLG